MSTGSLIPTQQPARDAAQQPCRSSNRRPCQDHCCAIVTDARTTQRESDKEPSPRSNHRVDGEDSRSRPVVYANTLRRRREVGIPILSGNGNRPQLCTACLADCLRRCDHARCQNEDPCGDHHRPTSLHATAPPCEYHRLGVLPRHRCLMVAGKLSTSPSPICRNSWECGSFATKLGVPQVPRSVGYQPVGCGAIRRLLDQFDIALFSWVEYPRARGRDRARTTMPGGLSAGKGRSPLPPRDRNNCLGGPAPTALPSYCAYHDQERDM